ncbi:MAG: class I SAM-dependent rRNA methyltransferase [Proteobacteria bacterium]|nr:class I SAM-dependent rRNA methyltransferase [Pseudomonadota bacterium]
MRLRGGCHAHGTAVRGGERRAALGHLWIFSNEIEAFDRTIPAGEDVRVVDHRGGLVGSGTFNPASLIAVRIHARGLECALDRDLVVERVRSAWENRRAWLGKGAAACRVVYGEADGLPGLVVDRYGDHLAVQVLTAAMEARTSWAVEALQATLSPRGVVLRNDTASRELEGLSRGVALGAGEVPARVQFPLHGLELRADLWGGQKTGFFFDQRENYRLLEPLVRGGRVLDAFCYSGAWGVHAAQWGAREVVFLDASEGALQMARANAEANGFARGDFVRADTLDYLRGGTAGPGFDAVVLDPPAFVKSRRRVPEALRGYLNLNKWGLRCVRPGGYLITCSCSHHVRPEVFVETVALAAREAGREVRVVGVGRQAPDHPWLPAMPETAYLKVLLLQVA